MSIKLSKLCKENSSSRKWSQLDVVYDSVKIVGRMVLVWHSLSCQKKKCMQQESIVVGCQLLLWGRPNCSHRTLHKHEKPIVIRTTMRSFHKQKLKRSTKVRPTRNIQLMMPMKRSFNNEESKRCCKYSIWLKIFLEVPYILDLFCCHV